MPFPSGPVPPSPLMSFFQVPISGKLHGGGAAPELEPGPPPIGPSSPASSLIKPFPAFLRFFSSEGFRLLEGPLVAGSAEVEARGAKGATGSGMVDTRSLRKSKDGWVFIECLLDV